MELVNRSKKIVTDCLDQFPNKVMVSRDFRDLITTVKEMDPVTHPYKVFDAFKDYIFAKGLIDSRNPLRVVCKDDQLGDILGMNEFTLADVAKILLKFVFPANSGSGCSHNSDNLKRSGEEVIQFTEDIKKFKSGSNDIRLQISPSAASSSSASSSGNEKKASLEQKNCEEDCSCNSSSEETYSIVAVEETFDIEYEVESDSSLSDGNPSFSESDSDIIDTLNAAIIEVICKSDSDMEFWADNSSDDEYSSSDSGRVVKATDSSSDTDKMVCSSCGELSVFPSSQCSTCFHKQMELIASEKTRPKRKIRSKRKKTRASTKLIQEGASNSSQKDGLECVPSTSSSQESFSSEKTSSQPLSDLSQDQKLCMLCCDRPANGTIVHAHSKYAHNISCYPCAKRLQREKKRCPVCRRKIDRVVCAINSL